MYVYIVMTTATPEKTDGLKALQTAIEEIDKTIQTLGGVFKIQMPVRQFILVLIITYFKFPLLSIYFIKIYVCIFNSIWFSLLY